MVTETQFEAIERVEITNDDLIDLLTMESLVVGHNQMFVGLDPVGNVTMLGTRDASDVDFHESVYAYPTDLQVNRSDSELGGEMLIRYGAAEQLTRVVELDVV